VTPEVARVVRSWLDGVSGEGPLKDPKRAAEFVSTRLRCWKFQRLFELGEAYALGKGVAKDTKRAQQLYQQACDDGNKRGCANLKVRKP